MLFFARSAGWCRHTSQLLLAPSWSLQCCSCHATLVLLLVKRHQVLLWESSALQVLSHMAGRLLREPRATEWTPFVGVRAAVLEGSVQGV